MNNLTPIIEEIFQTEKHDLDGYIPFSGVKNNDVLNLFPIEDFETNVKVEIISEEVGTSYEDKIVGLAVHGSFDVLCLAGGMGTGKTALVNEIAKRIKISDKKIICLVTSVDINELVNRNQVEEEFKIRLFQKLKSSILIGLRENITTLDNFFYGFSSNEFPEKYPWFVDFYSKESDNDNWTYLQNEKKITKFINFLASHKNEGIALSVIFEFLKFLKNDSKNHNNVVIVIDNIDRLDGGNQYKILQIIFSLIKESGIKCIFPCRRTTFRRNYKKYQKESTTKMSFSYNLIPHSGHNPILIISDRLKKFIKNHEEFYKKFNVKKEEGDLILNRAQLLLEFFNDEKDPFYKFIENAFGNSIRLALSICYRFFYNSIFDLRAEKLNPGQLIRATLCGDNNQKRIMCDNDQPVINLFSSPFNSGKFSLYTSYILFFIKDHKSCSLLQVQNYLISIIDNFNHEDFINSLNYLLLIKRPLIWSSDKSIYDFNNDILDQDDIFQLTELGEGYIFIIKHNLEYIQTCFLSINWEKYNYGFPPNFSLGLADRFAVIRKSILEIFDYEKRNFKKNNTLTKICFKVAFLSFSNIKSDGKYENNISVINEFENWNSLDISIANY